MQDVIFMSMCLSFEGGLEPKSNQRGGTFRTEDFVLSLTASISETFALGLFIPGFDSISILACVSRPLIPASMYHRSAGASRSESNQGVVVDKLSGWALIGGP